jgi:hypothetical protein
MSNNLSSKHQTTEVAIMRTTLTLDPDVEALMREALHRSGKSFKQAVNDVLRAGLAPAQPPATPPAPFAFPTYSQGRPLVDLTKALALAADLEDQATLATLAKLKQQP